MKVSIIVPPLLGHETRGTGVYFKNLVENLEHFTNCTIMKNQVNDIASNADLVHFPYFDPFFMTMPSLRFKKTVVTVHDLIPIRFAKQFPRGIKGEIKWQIQKRILSRVDAVITDSWASKKDVVTYININESKVHPIYLAPEKKYFVKKSTLEKQKVRRRYDLPSQFALYVGEVNWNKNLPNIIRAALQAKIFLIVVSRSFVERHTESYNPWKDSLLEAQELAAGSPLIKGIGYLEKDDLVTLYQLATVLLMPSFYEGFGLPIVEAMASGCPVITSSEGSLSEVTAKGMQLVDPNNISQIAKTLHEIFFDKEMAKKMSVIGKNEVKRFSWEKTAKQTFDVYDKVINNKT